MPREIHALWLLMPALPLVLYIFIYTARSYQGLFLVDLDYTGISSAVNNTVKGNGLLTTPYFHTGRSGSYLGHHFSPTLLLYAPAYFAANTLIGMLPESTLRAYPVLRTTHLLYGILLGLTLFAGLYAWCRLLLRDLKNPGLALFALFAFACAYPIWRLAQSFHYELPVLLFSALTLYGIRERRPALLWISLLCWMGAKEDIALYTFLLGAYFVTSKSERAVGWKIMAVSCAYFLIVNGILIGSFSGGDQPDWNYLRDIGRRWSSLNARPQLDMLMAFAFLPLLSPRLFLIAVLPIFVFHLFSGHLYHASFQGHYSYSVLPPLMLGLTRGLSRLRELLSGADGRRRLPAALLLAGAIILYSAAGEKETPLPAPRLDPRYEYVERLFRKLPRGACLQTMTFFGAHAPLDVYVFPLAIPAGNPYRNNFPPATTDPGSAPVLPGYCKKFYLFIDEHYERHLPPMDPRARPYTKKQIGAFLKYAAIHLRLVEQRDGMRLYKNK